MTDKQIAAWIASYEKPRHLRLRETAEERCSSPTALAVRLLMLDSDEAELVYCRFCLADKVMPNLAALVGDVGALISYLTALGRTPPLPDDSVVAKKPSEYRH